MKPQQATPTPPPDSGDDRTYSLGAVARLTGLSAHVLRAWERRYGAVQPARSAGGTRRYRESDVTRLRLLRSAAAAGHPIGEIAGASNEEIAHRLALRQAPPAPALGPVLEALERLDGPEATRLLGRQLAALGAGEFVRDVAAPLLREVGLRWASGALCVASEHLASVTLRNLLSAMLHLRSDSLRSAPILFTTLPGDQHDLGPVMAAVVAADVGGNALFVGSNLPVAEIVDAAETIGASAVAVGTCYDAGQAGDALAALRQALPRAIEVWIGGAGVAALVLPPGVTAIGDYAALERKVTLLRERRAGA